MFPSFSSKDIDALSEAYASVYESSHLETDTKKRHKDNEKAIEDMKKTKGYKDMAAAAEKKMEEGYGLDKEFGSMRKRGGRSAPPEERSVGGERNRSNKDYWADVQGKNRDRGAGNKAKRRSASLKNEEVFDVILSHLLSEGYADTAESATAIMANMSEEWRDSILEAREARENPEKHEEEKEKEDEKKYGHVRGEKTPMPPRGDKRREAFEKWYASQRG